MSHTLTAKLNPLFYMVSLTIINYATGGEAVAATELFGPVSPTIQSVIFAQIPAGQNSLGVVLFPVLVGNKVVLFQFSGGSPVEIPPTNNLNASVTALIWVQ
jgi:hypothetical protein